MIKAILIFMIIFTSNSFCEIIEDQSVNNSDCLILQDEDSIVCKYTHERVEEDKEIVVKWINPIGEIERERTLIIPAGHGSIYDFRYIKGRQKGIWQFIVIDKKKEYKTTFELH